MEPHNPYFPSSSAVVQLRPGRPIVDPEFVNNFWYLRYGKKPTAIELELVQDLYDAEIIDLDRQIGKLIDELERRGVLDDSIFVLTSDHGNEFDDHGGRGHGRTLFQEVVRVPLVIVLPDAPASRDVETTVELTDLPPTLLDLVGIPIPGEFEGHSLRPFLEQPSWLAQLRNRAFGRPNRFQGPGAALTELHRAPFGAQAPLHRRSLVAGDRKIVVGHSGVIEFYDIRDDPLEQNPDALTPSEREMLRDRFEAAVRQAMTAPAERIEKPLDARARENLRALGYVE
jgi:arylsulfatase A-like enzyme